MSLFLGSPNCFLHRRGPGLRKMWPPVLLKKRKMADPILLVNGKGVQEVKAYRLPLNLFRKRHIHKEGDCGSMVCSSQDLFNSDQRCVHRVQRKILTRALVAVEPCRPPVKDKRRHPNCSDATIASISKKVNIWGQRSVDTIKLVYIFNYINLLVLVDLHAQRHGFWPTEKEPFPRSEFTLALNLDVLDAGRSPNAVRHQAVTTQMDFEVDRQPPADSPPGDLLITIVKETVIL